MYRREFVPSASSVVLRFILLFLSFFFFLFFFFGRIRIRRMHFREATSPFVCVFFLKSYMYTKFKSNAKFCSASVSKLGRMFVWSKFKIRFCFKWKPIWVFPVEKCWLKWKCFFIISRLKMFHVKKLLFFFDDLPIKLIRVELN